MSTTLIALRPNPFARVRPAYLDGRVIGVETYAPVRGHGVRLDTILAEDDPDLARVLLASAGTGSHYLALSTAWMERLERAGLLVGADEVPQRVRIWAPLDETAELPLPAPPMDLVVDPALTVHQDAELPPELVSEYGADALSPERPLLSVVDPRSGVRRLCWIGDADRDGVASLSPGAPPPTELSAELRARLAYAGVLVAPDRAGSVATLASYDANLAVHGYVVVPGVLDSFLLGALRRYLDEQLCEGFFRVHEPFVGLRHCLDGGPWPSALHRQLAPFLGRLASARLEPTFADTMRYEPGAVLRRHTDRALCELVLSVLIDHPRADDARGTWPLWLARKPDGAAVALRLSPGDGVLYEGGRVPHWRDELPGGSAVTVMAFCYRRHDATR